MTPARFRWGIILIQLGILILLANLEIINYNFFFEAVVFIAVVLIFVGIEKIFTNSRMQFISYLTSIGILAVGFLIAYNTSVDGRSGDYWSRATYREKFEPGIERIQAVVDFDDIALTIRDAGSDLYYGRFDKYTEKPKVEYTVEDGVAKVSMTRRGGGLFGGTIQIDTDTDNDWYLRFSDQVPLDLECYGENSDVHLNMSTSKLEKLRLEADNTKIYLVLGNLLPQVTVSISGDNSNLKLRVPKDVGLKILGQDYRSYLVERMGMTEAEDGAFLSEGFDTLQTQVEVDLDERLKSFTLDYF